MALFARKNKNVNDSGASSNGANGTSDPNGTAVATAAGTLTSDDAALGVDSNTDEDALYQSAIGGKKKGKKAPRVVRGLKGGAVVGLNIGNEAIKAVELRGKGLDVVVTAVGSVPTPPDCLSNGVILNPVSLASALRDLFLQSGIKSRNVISSVSGSGALVVRVLEVARMSDAELAEHMNTDLERYVPFPPNDVVKDYRPLRELPSDPDAPNMEVLLAAAQNEVIDQHLQVLKDAKIEPQAIDVEPLAAARAVFYDKSNNGVDPIVDYNAATAVVNIGATATEISVLRGDILVFTRSVPVGGQAMTQALCDTLGMAWPDAEQTKIEMGDALPPHSGETPTVVADDDWSAFGETEDDVDPFSPDFYNDGPNGNDARGSDPQQQHQQKQDGAGEGHAGESSENDLTSTQPKEPRLPDFDLSRFNFSEDEIEVDETIPTTPAEENEGDLSSPKPMSVAEANANAAAASSPNRAVYSASDAIAPTSDDVQSSTRSAGTSIDFNEATLPAIDNAPTASAPYSSEREPLSSLNEEDNSRLPGVLDFPMAGEDEGLSNVAPSGQMYGMNSAEDPDLISFPSLPPGLIAAGLENDVFYDDESLPTRMDEDEAALPSMEALTEVLPSGATSSSPTSSAPISSVDTTKNESVAPVESVFDFSDAAPATSSADDFESAFADMIGDAPSSSSSATSSSTPSISAPAVTPSAFAMDSNLADAPSDFDLDQFSTPSSEGSQGFGLDDFGFGAGIGDSNAITPLKIYEVLQPRLAELVAEVRRSLEYFSTRYPDAAVQRIVLVGGGARLANMDAMMTQELGIPTVVDKPLSRLPIQVANLPANFVDEQGATFAVATGLALRDLVS